MTFARDILDEDARLRDCLADAGDRGRDGLIDRSAA
jgi:hypothetical protein